MESRTSDTTLSHATGHRHILSFDELSNALLWQPVWKAFYVQIRLFMRRCLSATRSPSFLGRCCGLCCSFSPFPPLMSLLSSAQDAVARIRLENVTAACIAVGIVIAVVVGGSRTQTVSPRSLNEGESESRDSHSQDSSVERF